MVYLMQRLLLLLSLMLIGCAGQPVAAPLAVAQPLTAHSWRSSELAAPEIEGAPNRASLVSFEELESGFTALQGPVIKGTRGDGLNMATALYQLLAAMGHQAEVRCDAHTLAGEPSLYYSRVQVFFRSGLSSEQKRRVSQMLSSARFLSRL